MSVWKEITIIPISAPISVESTIQKNACFGMTGFGCNKVDDFILLNTISHACFGPVQNMGEKNPNACQME